MFFLFLFLFILFLVWPTIDSLHCLQLVKNHHLLLVAIFKRSFKYLRGLIVALRGLIVALRVREVLGFVERKLRNWKQRVWKWKQTIFKLIVGILIINRLVIAKWEVTYIVILVEVLIAFTRAAQEGAIDLLALLIILVILVK